MTFTVIPASFYSLVSHAQSLSSFLPHIAILIVIYHMLV